MKSMLSAVKFKIDENTISPEEMIKKRFDYQLAVVKTYVRFLQEVKDVSYQEAKDEVMKLSNELIEQFNFGSKFLSEVESYLKLRYNPSPVLFRKQIADMSDIEDKNVLIILQDQFQTLPAFESLDARFKIMLT